MTKQDILDNKHHRDQIAQRLVLKYDSIADLKRKTGLCDRTVSNYLNKNREGIFCPNGMTFTELCHAVGYDPSLLYKRRDLINKPR